MSDDDDNSSEANKHKALMIANKAHGDGKNQGCVVKCESSKWNRRHGSYRRNGYVEITTKNSVEPATKASYYNLDFTTAEHKKRLDPKAVAQKTITFSNGTKFVLKKADPSEQAKKQAWFIGETHGRNFKKDYLPYSHNYHHIMPYTSLQDLKDGELAILMEATYNLNAGPNLIILPQSDEHAFAVMLPAHPHGHTDYNKSTKILIKEIRDMVKQSKANHTITKKNVKAFKTKLESWQDDQFVGLADYGKRIAKKKLAADVNKAPIAKLA